MKNRPLPIISWALYDFANTLFSILVVTRYLPPMLKELTGGSSSMGAAAALSMILAGLMVPVLGAISDHTGRNRPYLFYALSLSALATSMISLTHQISQILFLFFIANMTYQISMVFYNSLLPSVCSKDKIGTVSGLGVALGYAGSFFGLIAGNFFVRAYGVHGIFLLTGVLFFAFSLPILFWVRERHVPRPVSLSRKLIYHRFQSVIRTLSELPSRPALLFFLLGNFFCLDAVNTTIIFYSEFLQNARGVSGTGIDQCLLAIQMSALLFSLLIGRWTDRFGPKVMILSVTGVWIMVISIVLLTEDFRFIFSASVLGGFGLGGIWVTGRAWLLELAPSGETGKYMGFYGMTGKFSAIGALIFGLLADHFSYDTALAFQLVMLCLGGLFFMQVRRFSGESI